MASLTMASVTYGKSIMSSVIMGNVNPRSTAHPTY